MNIEDSIAQHLRGEGFKPAASNELSKILIEQLLSWKKDEEEEHCDDIQNAKAIFAFSFGFRFDHNGNRKPGLVNKKLAEKVVVYFKLLNDQPEVYAQWEIAEILSKSLPSNKLHKIRPNVKPMKSPNDQTDYLSTNDVLNKISKQFMVDVGPKCLHNPVIIVAHRCHILRCARLARDHGFDVMTHPDDMPSTYDPKSGQLWTAEGITHVVSDMISRLTWYRSAILYPRIESGETTPDSITEPPGT